ncbi:Uncharacterised protein [Streptococcus pneumoniae]|nr:Uncharacterised protein [Streptococcus pneumoniae]
MVQEIAQEIIRSARKKGRRIFILSLSSTPMSFI